MPLTKRYPSEILATCPVPWDEDFAFDESVFHETTGWICESLSRHVYVFGTAGEGYAVSDGLFLRIVRSFRSAVPPDASPMVGVISLSLATMIDRVAAARDLGIRNFQLSLPSWGALTDAEVDRFFAEVCPRFPDCRFLHYNLMRSKRLLTGMDYARLSAMHPNLVAVKMGGENLAAIGDILDRAPELQVFLTEFAFAAMRGDRECGLLAALSAADHEKGRELFGARGARLASLGAEFREVHRAIKSALDPTETHMDGAYDKVYVKRLRPEFPLRLLPPYSYPSDTTVARFEAGLPESWRRRLHQ